MKHLFQSQALTISLYTITFFHSSYMASLVYISHKSKRDHKNLSQNEEMPWVLGQAVLVNFLIWGKLLNLSETQFSYSLKLESKHCLHKFTGMMK